MSLLKATLPRTNLSVHRLSRSVCGQFFYSIKEWATVDPSDLDGNKCVENLVNGTWKRSSDYKTLQDPMNGKPMLRLPDTKGEELKEFGRSLLSCPSYGLHNPFYNVHRYAELGQVNFQLAVALSDPDVINFFAKLIQRVTPKSKEQCIGEITTCRKWLQSFSGDQVRNLAKSFGLPGDHNGQSSQGYSFPFGPTCVITPFNFPMEIPLIQSISSLLMGNKVLLKVDEKVSVVMEQLLRLAHLCGLPKSNIDFINCAGPVLNNLLSEFQPRMTLFTGSQSIAEKLSQDLLGKVRIEDAGFDWKVLGPDVPTKKEEFEFIVWQSDQDAYGFSGQKCSAQSMLFIHENWLKTGLVNRLGKQAARRTLKDFSLCPVLTWNNDRIQRHLDACLAVEGCTLAFGGKPLTGHSIPECYGAFQPTAVQVPIRVLEDPKNFDILTTELFGPFQVLVTYEDATEGVMLDVLESMKARLTAAVVSNDILFINKILARTTNGTIYVGRRARTTGAPQQHWFGPCGDPRAAGIHTAEAIKLCWSGHREVITDVGPVDADFVVKTPN